MSKAFAFELGQRVNVPGKSSVQGVVALPTTGLEGLPFLPLCGDGPVQHIFLVRWIAENGERDAGFFTSSDLLAAQTPPADAVTVEMLQHSLENALVEARKSIHPRARSRRAKTIGSRAKSSKRSGRGVRESKNKNKK